MEGCYIPFDWEKDFPAEYREQIRTLPGDERGGTSAAITGDIQQYAGVVEHRLDDSSCTMETLLRDNAETLEMCRKNTVQSTILIDENYHVDF